MPESLFCASWFRGFLIHSRMVRLVIATRNVHKTRELRELLGSQFILNDLTSHPEIAEVIEDGVTFEENAGRKARAVSRQLPGLVLADDSGLEVDSLGGAPGIFSARYAGEKASDRDNREKLLRELAEIPSNKRAARFCCVLVLARAGEVLGTFRGEVSGTILGEERGVRGFGYDPLFQPNDCTKSFAELSAAEKNALSHRGAAVRQLKEFLERKNLPF